MKQNFEERICKCGTKMEVVAAMAIGITYECPSCEMQLIRHLGGETWKDPK